MVKIYAYHLMVPGNHEIFSEVQCPEAITVESKSSSLSSLAFKLKVSHISKGIKSYNPLWEHSKGHVDKHLFIKDDEPCFRTFQCSVLIMKVWL